MLVVLTTTSDSDEAESLAQKLVDEQLAACVQVLPQISSFYWWEDEVRTSNEYLLLIKTTSDLYKRLEAFLLENHSYEVPEIIALEAREVSESYSSWAAACLDR